jgi:hypothetical protein
MELQLPTKREILSQGKHRVLLKTHGLANCSEVREYAPCERIIKQIAYHSGRRVFTPYMLFAFRASRVLRRPNFTVAVARKPIWHRWSCVYQPGTLFGNNEGGLFEVCLGASIYELDAKTLDDYIACFWWSEFSYCNALRTLSATNLAIHNRSGRHTTFRHFLNSSGILSNRWLF